MYQFSVELDRLTAGKKERVRSWAANLLGISQKRKYTEVRITELANDMSETIRSLIDVARIVPNNGPINWVVYEKSYT
jgi:hypothetical protein